MDYVGSSPTGNTANILLKKEMTPIDVFSGDYRFLSNFYSSLISVDGVLYPTVEHAFHAAKTNDKELKEKIRQAQTPGKAKRLGHQVELREDWDDVRISIMEDLLRKKFSIQGLKEKLLATKGRELVEGNTWNDTFWGVCNGIGENHLGKLLMKIRDEL